MDVDDGGEPKSNYLGGRMKQFQGMWLLVATLLATACQPEQQKAKWEEKERIECLDKPCPGDVEPEHGRSSEFAIKLNGQWFMGPREYGGYGGSLAFFWPSRTPARAELAAKMAPEFVPSEAGVDSNFYDVAIEIFLRHDPGLTWRPNRHERLLQAQTEGRVISKEQLQPGLEVWRTRETDGLGPGLWYVATEHVKADPNAAVLSCRVARPESDRCVTAFEWKPGIAADVRLRARHASDWPRIYREATRVLQQLRAA